MQRKTEWLPSELQWIEDIVGRVLSGEILLVRSLPRWGLTNVCASVDRELGASAVSVGGRTIGETAQRAIREAIDKDVSAKVDEQGYAQLIFDDYGYAIRHSQGGALHSMLYRLLVDSAQARDIGALLVARAGDMLDLNFAGSPLLGRTESVPLPLLAEIDATTLGVDLDDLRRMAGESTWLARRFMGRTVREGRINAVEHLNADRRRIVDALPVDAVEVLLGARQFDGVGVLGQEALLCLGAVEDGSKYRLASLVAESNLLDEIRLQSPGWPRARAASLRRFADLLAGVEDAIWVDRYALSRLDLARQFLNGLRRHTSARLRILVSRDRDRSSFAQEIVTELGGISKLEVRFMNRSDRHRLHDRHLVLPTLKSGFVLPTAGVIFGQDDPGSAVSVAMPNLAINYSEYWRRADRVLP
ncbi:hypothetical protein [Amycolatopsis sp. NBC_01286]|uniref:hypothetical protein n=1 Tax=Amycolatopsis sp. NBC_01286 TaxID=2903560 RepID=UPI002E1072E1|nr:hypothetical protein OG570_28635 [Amycolatopsis sp. NBC_01286]